MKKGKEKKEENYIRKGEKGLKKASFWAINSKNFAGGSSDPPPLAGGRPNLFVEGKNESQKGGKGNDQNAQYISLITLIIFVHDVANKPKKRSFL